VRYEVAAEPCALYVCHCRECRKQSASAFGVSVEVPVGAFAFTQGDVRTWSRATERGGRLDCLFCGACGSRVMHRSDGAATVTIKGGSLDTPLDLSAAIHIWTSRKLPGVLIPDAAVQFLQEPD
jgi:hypothetical protein